MTDRVEIVTVPIADLEAIVERAIRKIAPPPDREPSEVMTRKQVGELLQVEVHGVAKLVKDHSLPAHRLGGEWRFLRSEVLAWLAKQNGAA